MTGTIKISKKLAGQEYFTCGQAAEYLKLDKHTIRHYCHGDRPRMRGIKLGHDWLIPVSEVVRYARERRQYIHKL